MVEPSPTISPPRTKPADLWVPPGHFYSPIPDPQEIARRADQIFEKAGIEIPGVNLAPQAQIQLLEGLVKSYRDDYFLRSPTARQRYGWDNPYFPFGDAFLLCRFILETKPARIIEVGSGWSSAAMLDACDELRLTGARLPNLTFIEPYPERLHSLLRGDDEATCTLLEQQVQDVPLSRFKELEAGDLLFIDSSHIVKTGSDLTYLFFEVLPALARGVWIFVHDITWPFEYPRVWVDEGRSWNEIYLLRAFLQYNSSFRVRLFPGMVIGLELEHTRRVAPMLARHGGTGMWIERIE